MIQQESPERRSTRPERREDDREAEGEERGRAHHPATVPLSRCDPADVGEVAGHQRQAAGREDRQHPRDERERAETDDVAHDPSESAAVSPVSSNSRSIAPVKRKKIRNWRSMMNVEGADWTRNWYVSPADGSKKLGYVTPNSSRNA